MNKSYRSVWNEALGAWVAVSEIEGGRSKNSVSSLGSEFDDVTSRPALTLNNIAKVTFLGLLSLVGNNALAQQDVIGTIKFDVLANTSTKMRTIQSTGHVADLTTTAYSNAMTGASAGNTSGFIYSNGDFSSAYTGYWYNDDRKGKSRVVFSPVKTEVKKVNSLGTQTAEVRVLGTKIGDKSVSALSDNLSFANNYDSRFMNSGLSDGISYSLLQDDIIQVNFNEHAKAINTLTEITKTHHDQIQTGSKEPITFVADIGSVSRKLGETLNVKTVGAKYGTYSGDNLRTTITGDTLNIEFNNDPNFNSLTTTQDVKVGGSMLVKGHSTMKGGATVYQKLAVKPYASVDMGSNVINHVGAGVVDSDAVNLGQLKNVQQTAEKGWNIQANNDLATRVGPGETVQFLDGQNIDVTRQGHNVTIATADDVSFSTLQVTGQTTLGNLSIKKNSQVNLGGNKITNLGDGVADSDAVTIKQLNEATMAAGKQPTTSAGKNITVEKRTDSLGGIDYKVSTADDLVVNSVVAGVSTLNRTGLHIAGGPSITTAGVNAGGKTITNVAPGVYPRDAVNVSQLEDVKGIATKGWELSTNTGATTNVAPGDTVDFVEGQNIKLSNTGRTVTVASASDVNFNNVTVTGDTHVNNLTATGVTNLQNVNVAGDSIFNGGATFNEGLTVNNNFTVGGNTTIDMGGNKITNIKEGDSYHDAVNYGQVTNMYNNLANKPMSFAGNTGSVDRKLGETLNITGSASTAGNYSGSNVKVVADAAGIQVQFAESPAFNSVSTVGDANIGGNTTVGGDLSVAGDTTVNNLSVNANSVVNLGGNKITNLGDGVADSDAVTIKQLNQVTVAAGKQATTSAGKNIRVEQGLNSAGGIDYKVHTADDLVVNSLVAGKTTLNTTGLHIANGPSITTGGVNAGGLTITNVAAGVNMTDAVNVGQLEGVKTIATKGWELSTNTGATTNVAPGDTVDFVEGQNIKLSNTGRTVTVASASDVSFNNVTVTGDTHVKNLTATGVTNLQTLNVAGATNLQTLNVAGDSIFNGGATFNEGLTVNKNFTVGGNTTVDMGGNKITNVKEGDSYHDAVNYGQVTNMYNNLANKPMSFAGNTGSVDRKLGETLNITGSASTAGNYSGSNVKVVADATGIQVQFAENPVFNSISTVGGASIGGNANIVGNTTIGGNATVGGDLSVAGDTTVNNLNVNANSLVDLGGNKITNLGDGVADSDAVTIKQLNQVSATAGKQATTTAGKNIVVEKSQNAAGGVDYKVSTDDNLVVNSVIAGASTLNTTGLHIAGGPSITISGVNAGGKTITNVAAGVNTTDAVNVGQLDAVNATANKGWELSTNTGTTTNVAPGDTVDFVEGQNIKLSNTGRTVTVASASDVNFNNVTVTGDTVVNNLTATGVTNLQNVNVAGDSIFNGGATFNEGLTVNNNFTVGGNTTIDMGGNKITNVKEGDSYHDAVNYGQVTNMYNNLANKPMSFAGNTGSVDRKLGETLNITGGASTAGNYSGSNVKVVADATGIQVQLAENPVFNSVSTVGDANIGGNANIVGNTTIGGGATVGGDLSVAGSTTVNNLSVNANSLVDLGGNKITNLGDGVADSDAVTIKQLNQVSATAGKQATTTAGNNIAVETSKNASGGIDYKVSTLNDLTVNSVVAGATTLNTTGLRIAGGPSITTTGINAGGMTITNVAAGVNTTDAVNVGQLDAVNATANKGWELSTNTGTTTNVAPGDTVNFVEGQNIKLSNTGRTVTVASASDVNFNNVTVTGDTVVNNLSASGVTNLQTLNVAGATNLQTLNVAGDSIFNGGATFNEGLTVNNNFTVGGNTTIDMGGNKITNVAAGTDDDDAATVGQINTVVDNLANKPMSFAGNTGSVDRKLGETLNITGSASTAGNYSGSNVKVVADAAGIQVQFAENPVFNSVSTVGDANIGGNANIVGNATIGGGATVGGDLSVAGSTTVNNLSVNANSLVDLGGNKITNVGDGVADSDAVTIKQLNVVSAEANKQASTSAGKNIEVETSLNATGGIDYKVSTADDLVVNSLVTGASSLNRAGLRIANSGPSITTTGINAGGMTITNVAAGVNTTDAVNVGQLDAVNATANKGWELSTNTGTTTNVAPGDTVNFIEGQNIKLSNTGRTVTVASASDVNFNNVTVTGDTVVNNLTATGVTNLQNINVAGDSIFNGGATFNEGLTVNKNFTVGGNTTVDMGGNKITNVKEGDSYHDAVNYGQVTNMYNNLANKPMSFAGNTGSVDRKLGETLNITGGASTAGNYSGSNVKVVADAAGIQVQFAENPVFNSVSTVGDANIGGNANIVGNTTIGGSANIAGDTAIGGNTTMAGDLNVAGNTTVNNLSVNTNSLVDLGGNKITNVGDGVADSDAVTIKQLNVVSAEANKQASTSAGKNIEVETSLNATGGIDYKVSTADDLVVNSLVTGASSLNRTGLRIANSGPSITTTGINAGGMTITNVAAGVNTTDAVNVGQLDAVNATANKGWELSTNTGATTNVAPGDTVNFVEGQNIKLSNTGRTVTVASASDVNFNNVTVTGDTHVNNLTATGTTNLQTLNVAGATNLQTLNVAGDTVVNNLSASGVTNLQTLNVVGATNLQTLNVAGDTVLNNLSASGVTNLQTLNVAGDSIFNGGATFNEGLTVNKNFTVGGNTTIDMGGNKITNVAAGTDDDDAATVGQINTVVDNLANKPMSFAGNTGSVDRKLGETLNITGGASTAGSYSGSNVKVVADATGIQVQFAENPVFNSVSTVGDAIIGGNANIVGNTTIGGSANIAGDTAIGGNTTMAGDLNVAGNTTVNNLSVNANSLVDLGGNKITNVGDGVADSDAVTIKQLNVVSAEANKQASTSAGKNIEVETSLNATGGIDYKVSTADDLVVNSLVTGASSLNRTGLRIANSGPSITTTGINAGNFVITNVADGVNKTDAVNKGQLDEVQTTASKGWELSTNSGATTNVAPGDTVNFVEGQNIKLTNTGRTVTVASASDVKFNSLMVTGETTLNDLRVSNNTVLKNLTATGVTNVNTLNVSGASVFNAGATFSKGVTINENLTVGAGAVVNMGGNKITNVAVGTADNDAATVGQINTVVDGLASTPMGFAGNTGMLNRKLGETLKITGSNSVAGTYSGANIRTRAEGDTVHIEMADAPVFTGGLTVNGASNLTGGATIGSSLTLAADTTVSMGMNVVSGVASGVKDNDAVNLSQLKEVKNIADNAAAEAGKGWNLSDGVTTTKVAPGATATISNTDNNIDVKLTGTNMSINLAQDIAINSITVQNGGPVINNTGINMHEQRITNLGDAVTLSDAVNLKQLNEVKNTLVDAGWNLQVNGDTPSKVKNGDTVAINSGKNIQVTRTENGVSIATEDDVSYNSVTAQTQVKVGSTTVNSSGVYVGGSSGPSMTSEGVDAGHSVVSNVADGRAPSDAVNVSQLHRATEGISSNINKLASDMSRIEKNANAGSATAGAIASLPQAGNAGETMFAIAHAGYRGESAYAAGLSAVSDNGKWVLKGNLAGNSRGGVMYGVGAGYRW